MKVTIEEINKEEQSYPCLKEHEDGSVIFFTAPSTGVCLKAPTKNENIFSQFMKKKLFPIGLISNQLNEQLFSILKKPLVISPDDFDKSKKYPCIKKTENNCVVLFIENEIGFCLEKGSCSHFIGELTNQWDETKFKLIESKLILSND